MTNELVQHFPFLVIINTEKKFNSSKHREKVQMNHRDSLWPLQSWNKNSGNSTHQVLVKQSMNKPRR